MSIKQENLIPLTGNYLPGQRFVMIDGTLVPVGFGTPYIPGSTIVTPSDKGVYYKCASVDADNSKWTGYKASQLDDGTWAFAEEVTTDLTFTEIKPEKDSIYSYDALVNVRLWNGSLIPEEGLVFYAPLSVEASTAETGQTLTTNGTVTYETVDGIPCALFNGSDTRINSTDCSGLPSGASPRSLCAWVRTSNMTQGAYAAAYGTSSSNQYYGLNTNNGGYRFAANSNSNPIVASYTSNTWHFIVGAYDGAVLKLYRDGQLYDTQPFPTAALNTNPTNIDIGARYNNKYYFDGYISSVRIYDRVLTDDEVLALSEEFTPTA